MAKYFDVAAAKADGMSDDEIKRIMEMNKLQPKPVEQAAPAATPSAGMATTEAVAPVSPPVQPKEKSGLAKLGQGAIDVFKGLFAAPARLGKALGGAAGMVATQKDFEATQEQLRNTATQYTQKGVELSKAGNKDEARKMFKLAQETIQKGQEMANERIAAAEQGKEDTIKGGVGTAAFFVPGGQATLPARIATGAATGAAAGYGASKKGEELESALGGGLVGGAVPVVATGLGKVFGALKPKGEGNVLKRAGDYLREDATKIRVKPSVWGAQKEKAIQQTLNDLGIEGTPQQKYELLAPKMEQLGSEITTELKASPKQIPVKDVFAKFKDALKSSIRTSDLTTTTAQKEIKGYLTDLYEAAGFKASGTISNEEFFALKKLVNEDYQGVAKKLISNTPLNDREKVIQVARQVFDDVVSAANPKVKDMTVMQSHLYDASSSLSHARDAVPTTRIAGTTVPTPIIKGGEDKLGVMLQRAGEGVQKVQDSGMSAANAVGSVLPPANIVTATGVGMAGGEQNGQNAQDPQQTVPQGSQGGGDQNNGDQQVDHTTTISQPEQTVTGYSVEQLGKALTAAQLAGDTAAVKELKMLYELESNYQAKQKKSATATKAERLNSVLEKSIDSMQKLYFADGGSLSAGSTTTGVGGIVAKGKQAAKKALSQDFSDRLVSYNQMKTLAIGVINKAREAGVLNAGEFEQMMAATPNEQTSEKVAKQWFKNVKDLLVNSPLSYDEAGMTPDEAVQTIEDSK